MKQLILILVSLIAFNMHAQHVVDSALNANGIYVDTTGMNIPDSSDFANVVYIDPDAATNGDGSLGSPYNSWDEVTLAANTAYLQKCATQDTANTLWYDNTNNNVMIGSYGEGDSPVVNFSRFSMKGQNCVVRDIEYWGRIELGAQSSYCYIYNVIQNGLQVGGAATVIFGHHHKIIATKVHNNRTEGIFVQDQINGGTGNEFAYNHIHNINEAWFPGATQVEADGDGLQVSTFDSIHIHHNIIDRSNSGNKFCIILRDEFGYHTGSLMQATIEWNILIMPKSTSQGGAAIYMEEEQYSIIRNNDIRYVDTATCELYAIYCQTGPGGITEMYGNLIDVQEGTDVFTPNGQIEMWNNTIIAGTNANTKYLDYVKNNILSVYNADVDAQNIWIDQEGGTNLFVDYNNRDYRLKTGSVAIDSGVWDVANMSSSYTHDLDSSNVPQNQNIDIGAYQFGTYTLTWCEENPITQSATTGNDTVGRSPATGFIDVTASGANDNFTYSWSSGQSTEDISNIEAGTYSLTITDIDSSCTSIASYSVSDIDTESSTVNIDTLKLNYSDNAVAGWETISFTGTNVYDDYTVIFSGDFGGDAPNFGLNNNIYPQDVAISYLYSTNTEGSFLRTDIIPRIAGSYNIELYLSRAAVTDRFVDVYIDNVLTYDDFDVGSNDTLITFSSDINDTLSIKVEEASTANYAYFNAIRVYPISVSTPTGEYGIIDGWTTPGYNVIWE